MQRGKKKNTGRHWSAQHNAADIHHEILAPLKSLEKPYGQGVWLHAAVPVLGVSQGSRCCQPGGDTPPQHLTGTTKEPLFLFLIAQLDHGGPHQSAALKTGAGNRDLALKRCHLGARQTPFKSMCQEEVPVLVWFMAFDLLLQQMSTFASMAQTPADRCCCSYASKSKLGQTALPQMAAKGACAAMSFIGWHNGVQHSWTYLFPMSWHL